MYVMISVRLASRVSVRGKNVNIAIFSGTINVMNGKLCAMVVLLKLLALPIIPLSVTLIVFQGHSSVKQFQLKILCSYPIKLKFCICLLITASGL